MRSGSGIDPLRIIVEQLAGVDTEGLGDFHDYLSRRRTLPELVGDDRLFSATDYASKLRAGQAGGCS